MTEHEESMLEQKKKREEKKAKAAQFRALADAAAEDGSWPEDYSASSLVPSQRDDAQAARHDPLMVKVSKHAVQKRAPTQQLTEEELKAQVNAMMISRRQALERNRPVASSPSAPTTQTAPARHEQQQSDEDRLDALLDGLVERGVLSDAAFDRITDSLATGKQTVQACMAQCAELEAQRADAVSVDVL
jgi:hypothetical protein|eukprot:5335292-Prymnesium_polylepis.1